MRLEETLTTYPLQKSLSKVFPNRTSARLAEIAFLLLLGMVAITIHNKLRIPMHLPGKQGILFMAIVVTGRGLTSLSYASSIMCTGSALLLLTPWLRFNDPLITITYLLLGGALDLLYAISTRFSKGPWLLSIASGLAWMFMPLSRLIISGFTSVPSNMFISGFTYPFVTHFLFGFLGGLIGTGILVPIYLKR